MILPHTLHWKGWGIQVFLAFMGWPFAVVLGMVATGYYQPDPHKVTVVVLRLFAVAEGLAAVTIWLISAYREAVAPGVDEFMWIRVKYWIWVVGLGAAALMVASFFVR